MSTCGKKKKENKIQSKASLRIDYCLRKVLPGSYGYPFDRSGHEILSNSEHFFHHCRWAKENKELRSLRMRWGNWESQIESKRSRAQMVRHYCRVQFARTVYLAGIQALLWRRYMAESLSLSGVSLRGAGAARGLTTLVWAAQKKKKLVPSLPRFLSFCTLLHVTLCTGTTKTHREA